MGLALTKCLPTQWGQPQYLKNWMCSRCEWWGGIMGKGHVRFHFLLNKCVLRLALCQLLCRARLAMEIDGQACPFPWELLSIGQERWKVSEQECQVPLGRCWLLGPQALG